MKNKKIPDTEPPYDGKTYFYIGLVATILSAVAFGLTFTFLGVYALISAVLISIAALSFLNTQKHKNNFKAVKYATIAAYVLLFVYLIFFVGGIIYSSAA